MAQPIRQVEDKFESEAIPLILAAIYKAREAAIQEKEKIELTIHISEQGGMDGLYRERKKRLK